jgi:hypothetical protein
VVHMRFYLQLLKLCRTVLSCAVPAVPATSACVGTRRDA